MNAVVHTTETKDNTEPVVRDTVTVTVKKAVDGRRPRKVPARGRRRVIHEAHLLVDKRVMDAAKAVMKPGQKIVLVNETEVMVVNK